MDLYRLQAHAPDPVDSFPLHADSTIRPIALWRRALGALSRALVFIFLLDFSVFLCFDVLPEAALSRAGVFAADPTLLQALRDRLGTSGPWPMRWSTYWLHLARGDLGSTLTGGIPIAPLLAQRLLTSVPIWLISAVMIVLLAVPAASWYVSARALTRARKVVLDGSAFLMLPTFVVAAFLSGLLLTANISIQSLPVPIVYLLCGIASGLLPAVISFRAAATTMHQASQSRFFLTYRMIGCGMARIRWLLLRNAYHALRTLLSRLVITAMTAAVFAELIFDVNGFASSVVRDAIRTSDLNYARSWLLITGAIVIAATELERI